MPDHIPSLCFTLRAEDAPPLLLRVRRVEYPPPNGEWHPDSDEVDEVVNDLVGQMYEAGQLWMFTSTNHWYDRMLFDIAQGFGFSDLSFVRSFCGVLGPEDLVPARRALNVVIEEVGRNPHDLPAKGNSDFQELIKQLPSPDALAGAAVSRDVDEWTNENPFSSYLISLRAVVDDALENGHYLVWYPTHP